MKRLFRRKTKYITIILILLISIGFAYISTQLDILGDVFVPAKSWDIHFENIQVREGSVEGEEPEIDADRTTVNFYAPLEKPGDFYEFTVDAVNDGNIASMVKTVTDFNLTTEQKKYLETSVKYVEGDPLEPKQELLPGDTVTYVVRVSFKYDIEVSDLPSDNHDVDLSFSVEYEQKDSTSKKRIVDQVDITIASEEPDTIYGLGDTLKLNISIYSDLDGSNQFNISMQTSGFILNQSTLYVYKGSTDTTSASRVITENNISTGYIDFSISVTIDGYDYVFNKTYHFTNIEQSNPHLTLSITEVNPKSAYHVGDWFYYEYAILNDGNLTLDDITLSFYRNGSRKSSSGYSDFRPRQEYSTSGSFIIAESYVKDGKMTLSVDATGGHSSDGTPVEAVPAELVIDVE